MNHIQYFSLIFLILKGNDFICIGLLITNCNYIQLITTDDHRGNAIKIMWSEDNILHYFYPGTVKVWDEGIEKNLQRKLMNAPCLQPKDVNWIEVRPNFHRRNLSFCLGFHNCRPFCCTFFQYNLQRASPSNALPCFYRISNTS